MQHMGENWHGESRGSVPAGAFRSAAVRRATLSVEMNGYYPSPSRPSAAHLPHRGRQEGSAIISETIIFITILLLRRSIVKVDIPVKKG